MTCSLISYQRLEKWHGEWFFSFSVFSACTCGEDIICRLFQGDGSSVRKMLAFFIQKKPSPRILIPRGSHLMGAFRLTKKQAALAISEEEKKKSSGESVNLHEPKLSFDTSHCRVHAEETEKWKEFLAASRLGVGPGVRMPNSIILRNS